jgi:alpha-galactosidase
MQPIRSRDRFLFIGPIVLIAIGICRGLPAQVAQTPLMGWNSYDSYGALVTEEQFRANVDYMAQHLKPHGYEYAVLDYCWSYPYRERGRTGSEALNQRFNEDEKLFTPRLAMDDNGRLLPDKSRFPSAYDQEGKFVGLGRLAHYVHSKGLKLGIHIMRGIPRQAVVADCKIAGSDATASQVADTSNTCGWLNHMYGLKTEDGQPTGKLTDGAQAYYDSIVKMYADWGVDFIKADDMLRDFSKPNRSFYAGEINGVRRAIDHTGRPIVFSLSPGAAPLGHAKELAENANMWRMLDDMWDNWKHVNSVFDVARNWTDTRAIGHWPDADMLPLGSFVRPPVGNARKTKLTPNEQRTVMTLWSIAKSPLILGCDLPSLANDPETTALLTNDEVLAVDQRSTKNRQISLSADTAVWAAESASGDKVYVALSNRGSGEREVAVEFNDLGLAAGPHSVRDLWNCKDLGEASDTFRQTLGEHGSALYEIGQSSLGKK